MIPFFLLIVIIYEKAVIHNHNIFVNNFTGSTSLPNDYSRQYHVEGIIDDMVALLGDTSINPSLISPLPPRFEYEN